MTYRYQNYRGGALVRASVDVNQRLQNTSLIVPSATDYAVVGSFRYLADTLAGTEYVMRIGSSGVNNPAIGLRNVSGSFRWVMNLTTGSATIILGSLTLGHCYRVVLCGGTSLLSGANHTGANGTDHRAVGYIYDLGLIPLDNDPTAEGSLQGAPTRTPTASAVFSSDADLANALKTSTTGIDLRAQVGYTDLEWSEIAIWTGSSLTRAIADLYGQYQRNLTRLGVTPNHAWTLSRRSTALISASPTAGSDEEFHLKDLGSGDGTATRNLTPAGSTLPAWSNQNIAPEIPSSEDPALAETWDDLHTRNPAPIKRSIARASGGAVIVKAGDSIFRETRYGLALAGNLLDQGYTIGSLVCHWRTSFLPVKVTWPAGVTKTTYCNAEVDASTDYLTLQLPSSADRWGAMCGGICEITGGTLGANNRCMTLEVTNDLEGRAWFADGDRIKARVSVFIGSDADQSADLLRCVGAGSTVDVDPASLTDFRRQPQDGATWAQIEAGGGAAVQDRITSVFVLVDCGTAGTTRSVEFRLPNGLTAGKKWRISNVQWIKCDGDGNPLVGPGVVHMIDHLADSSSFIDLWKSQTCTADGQKRSTDDRLGRMLAAWWPGESTDLVYCQIQQTENGTEAANTTNLGNLITRWDGVTSAMGITGNTRYLFVAHITNNVDKDSVVSDRVHLFDTRDAMVATAEANPTKAAVVSLLDFTRAFVLETSSEVVGQYTTFGLGEAPEVEADATLLAAIGGNAAILDATILHPSDDGFEDAAMAYLVGEIQAAALGTAKYDGIALGLGLGV